MLCTYDLVNTPNNQASDSNTEALSELKELAKSSGFSKKDEERNLSEQADAEKQERMAEMGCSVM